MSSDIRNAVDKGYQLAIRHFEERIEIGQSPIEAIADMKAIAKESEG